jgi:hypothetical protein
MDRRRTDDNFMAGSGFARTFIEPPPAPSEPPPKPSHVVQVGRAGTTLSQTVEVTDPAPDADKIAAFAAELKAEGERKQRCRETVQRYRAGGRQRDRA